MVDRFIEIGVIAFVVLVVSALLFAAVATVDDEYPAEANPSPCNQSGYGLGIKTDGSGQVGYGYPGQVIRIGC